MPATAASRTRLIIWLGIPLFAVVIIVSASALIWEVRTIALLQERNASLSRENGQLLRRIDDLTRDHPAAAGQPASPAAPAPRPAPDAATAEALAAEEQQVRRLSDSLAQSTAEAAQLQAKVTDLESQGASAAEENRRLSGALEQERKNLEDGRQAMEALRAQSKTDAGRVTDLESLNARLKAEAAAGRQSAAETQQTVSDLENIFRRREMYLNNILRRYREITEQYRAMSGVQDGRDRAATPLSSAEISRIQNSLALAEDDLKQLTTLSAQAQRLQKKLPAR
jgi:regulator of replication initiation timing